MLWPIIICSFSWNIKAFKALNYLYWSQFYCHQLANPAWYSDLCVKEWLRPRTMVGVIIHPWTSYQIRKIVDMRRKCRERFLRHRLQRKPLVSDRHASRRVRHARVVLHVGIANPRWRGKCSRHSRHMHNPQFYVSGERSMSVKSGLVLTSRGPFY